MHVCDKETSKCGIVNRLGELVVPLEMDYEDNIWETWVAGSFIVLNKDGKVGFLFSSDYVDDVYVEPTYDEWCYYKGDLSVRRGDVFYSLSPSTNIDLLEVPYHYTSFNAKYKDDLTSETGSFLKEQRASVDKQSYSDLSLNELINGYMLVSSEGKFNYKNIENQFISDKWFEKATNFDQYNQAKVIYRGAEFYIHYDMVEDEFVVTLLENIDDDMELIKGSYKDLKDIDEFFTEK